MTHAGTPAATRADVEASRGGLGPKLLALRTEIDTALPELGSQVAVQPATATERRMPPRTPIIAEISVRPIEVSAGSLDELGVIGCLLGLRPDCSRQ